MREKALKALSENIQNGTRLKIYTANQVETVLEAQI
jgi:hypothetical protein